MAKLYVLFSISAFQLFSSWFTIAILHTESLVKEPDPKPVAASPKPGQLLIVLVALAVGGLFFVCCRFLSGEWSFNEQYSYGWFVPLFALYLFWLRWQDRPAVSLRPLGAYAPEGGPWSVVGSPSSVVSSPVVRSPVVGKTLVVLLIVVAALVLLPLRVFEIGSADWRPLGWVHVGAVTTITLGIIYLAGGTPWLRHFSFPVLFLFVAVPWVTPIETPIVQGLMRLIAAAAAQTVALFGLPAEVQGNLIQLPTGLVGVNEACSGVRSLQTSLMIGLLFGELKRLKLGPRVLLVVAAIAIALFANFLRSTLLVWVASSRGLPAVHQWHDFAGYAIVVLVFAGTMWLAASLSKGKPEPEHKRPAGSTTSRHAYPFPPSTSYLLLSTLLVWIVAVEFGAEYWYRIHERNLVPVPAWTVQFPKNAPGFREIEIDPEVRTTLHYDDGHQVSWNSFGTSLGDADPPFKCMLFVFRWNPGGSSVVRARAHGPGTCLTSIGWRQISDLGAADYPSANGSAIPFRHVVFGENRNGVIAHTFFCLQEDELRPNEPRPDIPILISGAQPDWSYRSRSRAVFNGVRNLGQQVMEVVLVFPRDVDDATAEKKFAELAPKLIEPANQPKQATAKSK